MGRLALRAAWGWPEVEFTHVNETKGGPETAAHLLKFDSVHGRWGPEVTAGPDQVCIDGKRLTFSECPTPAEVPWGDLGIDLVLECSGTFRTPDLLAAYFRRGVRKVIVAAPVKDGALNVVVGVNDHLYRPDRHHLLTAASCTTNCLAPVVKVLHQQFGIAKGSMTTIHSYTNDQQVLDFPHPDLRRARAAALNMIPTSTGAAQAIGLVLPELQGKLDGYAMRVPTPNVSVVDLVAVLQTPTTADEINAALAQAATNGLQGILGYTTDPVVSSDMMKNPHSAIVDARLTRVLDGTLAKVVAWYDNEWGYSCRVADLIVFLGQQGL